MALVRIARDKLLPLLLHDTVWLDVRAEAEFEKGQLSGAHNAPILTTSERQQVGTCFKQRGSDAAIALGHKLVSGNLRAQRIATWTDIVDRHPHVQLCCWRGGMRSQIAQQWLHEAQRDVPVIEGGYKALRHTLLTHGEIAAQARPAIVIGGSTGSAKTALINQLPGGIDLEAHANHRGSSFGRKVDDPPSQASFENALYVDLLRQHHRTEASPVVYEDESRRIGAVSIPEPVLAQMHRAPIAVVDMPVAQRVDNILDEYVVGMRASYEASDSNDGAERYRQYLLSGLFRIRKRLGSERYTHLLAHLEQALHDEFSRGELSAHRYWIEQLLTQYYDRMYAYQLQNNRDRQVFSGSWEDVHQWALEQTAADR